VATTVGVTTSEAVCNKSLFIPARLGTGGLGPGVWGCFLGGHGFNSSTLRGSTGIKAALSLLSLLATTSLVALLSGGGSRGGSELFEEKLDLAELSPPLEAVVSERCLETSFLFFFRSLSFSNAKASRALFFFTHDGL